MPLERFSASWREEYVSSGEARDNARDEGVCVFCKFSSMGVGIDSGVVWRDEHSFIILNAFPYGSGHLLALPMRHVGDIGALGDEEYVALARAQRLMIQALNVAYSPDGMNVGMNLGQAAGAGIPKHLHVHGLPRWNGDTNFMSTIGETRVLPESLESTWHKVTAAIATVGASAPSVD